MTYRLCKLCGVVLAMGIGGISQAYALDYAYQCDEVLYSAKTSTNGYRVKLCASGGEINFNYGPEKGRSEVDILLNKDHIYYVPQLSEDGTANGKVGIKFIVGRYHYYIYERMMTQRVGFDEHDTETIPMQKSEVGLNAAKLVKYQLRPE